MSHAADLLLILSTIPLLVLAFCFLGDLVYGALKQRFEILQ